MEIDELHEYCLSKPHVEESFPFGPDALVFKVQGKMFCLMRLEADPISFNLKSDPEVALELRDRYDAVKPGYHMSKKHWNTVELTGELTPDVVAQMVDASYALVVKGLKKSEREAVAAALAALEEE